MSKKLICLLVLVLAAGAVVWILIGRTSEGPRKPGDRSVKLAPSGSETRPAPPFDPTPDARTVRRSGESDGRTGELEQFADRLRDRVVVDLGTIEDMGKQTATMLTCRQELSHLRSIKPADRTAAQGQRLLELERQNAIALGFLPEITSFQNDPDEYGRFFSSLLRNAAELNDEQTAAIYAYTKGRGEALVAAGLNAANEPSDPVEEEPWEEKRDAFNAETAAGVADLLPPGEAERIGFTAGFMELLEQDFDKADLDQ